MATNGDASGEGTDPGQGNAPEVPGTAKPNPEVPNPLPLNKPKKKQRTSTVALILIALFPAVATVVVAWFGYLAQKARMIEVQEGAQKITDNAALGGPIGSVVAYAGDLSDLENLPKGWRLCDGSVLSKREFPDLYKRLNRAWGGDSDNVRLPDLQGYFLRGVDNKAGRDPDAANREPSVKGGKNQGGDGVGTIQPDAIKEHSHDITLWVYYMYKALPTFAPGTERQLIGGVLPTEKRDLETFGGRLNDTGTVKPEKVGGKETRPMNASVYWIIRVSYEGSEKNASTKP